MNIFKILAAHDGALKEPNITNFLAYLLDPTEDHGLGNRLLLEVLKETDTFKLFTETETQLRAKLENGEYEVRIEQEVHVYPGEADSAKKNRRDIDILIKLFSSEPRNPADSAIPDYAICLENKIYETSETDDEQLNDEMRGLQQLYMHYDNTRIGLIYLVPSKTEKAEQWLEKVTETPDKKLLVWKSEKEESVVSSLRKILAEEAAGTAEPIYDTVKYMLRAFLSFVENGFKSSDDAVETVRERRDYGKPVLDYMKDVLAGLDPDTSYKVEDIKSRLEQAVKKGCNKELDPSTAQCQMYKVTVNEPNRIHYYINRPDNEKYNLFYYYPDENNRKELRKFSLKDAPSETNIYYRNDENESASCTVDELRERKENKQEERK